METVIGLDIGGSKSEVAVIERGGRAAHLFRGPGGGLAADNELAPLPELEKLLSGCSADASYAIANLGGKNKKQISGILNRVWNDRVEVYRESEGDVALNMAMIEGCSSILLAGTGTILLISTDKGIRTIGGWGWEFGDEGSGYWIGRAAIAHLLRCIDLGFPLPIALPFRYPEFDRWKERLSFRDDIRASLRALSRSEVASLAAEVETLAAGKADWASRILREAATQMAAIMAAGNSISGGAPIMINGGLSRSRCLMSFLKSLCMERNIPIIIKESASLAKVAAVMAARQAGWREAGDKEWIKEICR